jgi:F-type H+-transporting ATPase subunit b
MATPTTETLSACVDSYGSAIGMPQLCGEWMSNQIFWLLITLMIIFLVLSRIALPRIATILTERQGTITNDIAAAEDLKAKAAAAEEAYQQALIDARAEAARIVEATKAEIKADLDAAMATADAEITEKAKASEAIIADIRSNAMASVEEVAKATANELVAVLGGKTDEKAIDKAVDAHLKG